MLTCSSIKNYTVNAPGSGLHKHVAVVMTAVSSSVHELHYRVTWNDEDKTGNRQCSVKS